MIPNNKQFFIPELDGLRFMAFLLIFIHHASIPKIFLLEQIKSIGWIGVDIFFCLSAFLLTRLLRYEIEETGVINTLHFFIRRMLRIWPLYFIYVFIARIFSIHANVVTHENWLRALGLITFTDNIFAAFDGFNPILFTGHLWTISYEEQFYLILPFLIPWLVRLTANKRILLLVFSLTVGSAIRFISIYYHIENPFIWVLPITHYESIMAGVVIAFYDYKKIEVNQLLILTITLISIVVISLLPKTDIVDYHLMIVYPCIGIASAGVLCFLLQTQSGVIKNILSNKVLVYGGKISFGLYVFHIASMNLVDYLCGLSLPLLNLSLSLLLTSALASLSYFVLEKRFLLMKRRFTKVESRPVG